MPDARHKVSVPLNDPGVPSSDAAVRAEVDLANRVYMDRVNAFARPLANEARCSLDWALRCLSNSVMPR